MRLLYAAGPACSRRHVVKSQAVADSRDWLYYCHSYQY
jgi:hypothetical protein